MATREWKLENFDRVLVVEGHGDRMFYAEVLEHLGKHGEIFIQALEGKGNRKRELEVLLTPTLLERKAAIAVVVDADENPSGTRQSLEELLSRLTGQVVVEGAWTSGQPRIGLLVVPGGNCTGEIETLVWQSWSADPANAAQKQCVEAYIACMKAAHQTAQSPDKALLGALLAVRNDDDPRLGPGARSKVFDLQRPELTPLCQFLAGF